MQNQNQSPSLTNDLKNSFTKENSNILSEKITLKKQKFKISEKSEILDNQIQTGKWSKEEHQRFLDACKNHGNNWFKIREELKTRTPAQIRSHTQKYIIKLCKKYQIKIRGKKFKKKNAKHLETINNIPRNIKAKGINICEKKLLDIFNYYNREYKPFLIEKCHKNHDMEECNNHVKNSRIEKLIKNKIFLIEKGKKENEAKCEKRANKLYQDLESLKNHNQNFLNNFGFSFVNIDSNVNAQYEAILSSIQNQLDINFVKYSTQIKNDVDTFVNKLESNHLLTQNIIRQVENFCNGVV